MEMLLDAADGHERGTDDALTARDSNGNSALHYAYAFGRAQLSNLLEARMDDTVRSL